MNEDQRSEPHNYVDIYEFAAHQVSESRASFERYYKVTIGAVFALATLAVGGFYLLVGHEYNNLEQSVSQKADAHFEQLDADIRGRMEARIKDAIGKATSAAVVEKVKDEEPEIRKAAIEETRNTVIGLSPNLENEVQTRVAAATKEVDDKIRRLEQLLDASTLAILATHGDGQAYDKLMLLGASNDPQIRTISTSVQYQVYLDMTETVRPGQHFAELKTIEQMVMLLDDPDPLTREAAIGGLVEKGQKSIVPKLLDVAEHDPSLFVRRAAYGGLRALTGQNIEPLQLGAWKTWWAKNKDKWPQ